MEIGGGLIFILFIVIACVLMSSKSETPKLDLDLSNEDPYKPGYPSEKYKERIRMRIVKEDTTVLSSGGIHFAEFLMKEFIDRSNKEILIFERNFPGEIIVTFLPELKHFVENRNGRIRVLYVDKTSEYDKFIELFKSTDDVKIEQINSDYFEDYGDPGIYVFDSKGIRLEYDTENHKSLYCFNDEENALYIRNKFTQSGIL